MSLLIEEDGDEVIEADDWSTIVACPRELQRRELEKKMAEFTACGGRVQEFGLGETAIPDTKFLWSFPVGKAAPPDPVKKAASESRRSKAQEASAKRGASTNRGCKLTDDEMIVIIDQQLGVAKNIKLLCEALGCSNTLLQRLLFANFRHDERADPYRQVNRLDHEAAQVKKIRELVKEGQTGMKNITKLMGLKNRMILANLDRKYGLHIPRDEPGKKAWIACTNTVCHAHVSSTARYCPQCGTITARGLKGNEK